MAMVVDVVVDARRTRSWIALFVLLAVGLAIVAGAATQYAAPWVIYGGL